MAATGKKSKKAKWKPVSISNILAEPTAIPTTQNWADSVDDETETSYGGPGSRNRAPVVLPSASRAARGGMAVDDESIPRRPPFIAHISNLPYDVDESAISELFTGLKIQSLRLPREGDRLKGYGYVDFEDRESLINAMNIADLTISGRRIRIEVSTHDNDRRMGNRGRSDRDREYDPERTMGDWRSGPRAVPEAPARTRTMDRDNMRERERDSSTDNQPGGWRDGDRPAAEPARTPFGASTDNRPGGWRDGDRPAAEPARTPYGGRDSFGRDRYDREDRERGYGRDGERSGYGGRDGFRTAERDRYSRDGGGNRGFGERRGFGDREREPSKEESKPRERPKLNLLPRTVPRDAEAPATPADGAPAEPERPAPKPLSAEKVFGGAKPVDTAAKEREIEERLRKQEEEARRTTDDKDRWGARRNEDSGERRGGARKDDRGGKDSKNYGKDKRDYSKDDRDRRDYREDKDKRDYARDDREKRDYSRENIESRDAGDDKVKRDYSRESKDRRDYGDEKDKQDYKDEHDRRDNKNERDHSGDRRANDRDHSNDSKNGRRSRDENNGDYRENDKENRNGKEEGRLSRSRERPHDKEEISMPKLKEQEKPNFVGSNKFSFLEDANDEVSD